MRRFEREFYSRSFLRFILAGGIAALVNFGSRFLYSMAVGYLPAVTLAYLTGMATAFVLNRRFVFDAQASGLKRQLTGFALVNLVAIMQTLLISYLLARWILPLTGMRAATAEALAHLAGIVVPVFTSFLGHKYFTFQDKGPLS
jgi:putative flippase GtrA